MHGRRRWIVGQGLTLLGLPATRVEGQAGRVV
jgi:hypothetical protein